MILNTLDLPWRKNYPVSSSDTTHTDGCLLSSMASRRSRIIFRSTMLGFRAVRGWRRGSEVCDRYACSVSHRKEDNS